MDRTHNTMDLRTNISNESKRIEQDCLYSAKGHFVAANGWGKVHYWLGVPATILAALSGVSAISDYQVVTGILAIIVTSLSALLTFLEPSKKSASHLSAGNKYNSVRNSVRLFREVKVDSIGSIEPSVQELDTLSNARNELNMESPQIPQWAYRRAKTCIEVDGEALYDVDKIS